MHTFEPVLLHHAYFPSRENTAKNKQKMLMEGNSMNFSPSSSLLARFCLYCIFRYTVFNGQQCFKECEKLVDPKRTWTT